MPKITKRIRLRLVSLNPGRQQFKPYNYALEPVGNVLVEMEVPNEHVVEMDEKEGTIVLSLDGMSHILGRICDSIDTMHDTHVIRARSLGKVVA